ncbi:hypothetical protein FV226_22155 [Methylobacterium sp. WL12]|uniref:hypothetical protein n=1 Tax=Methylobacterium sp. WL12 TaxID=2603890 RepID=UPI0011CA5B5D|nr:hypothetical protein [Methylobacterium sp. WL12]TXM67340.1 hypothetical protein FV226_22155 [Methylobacterium sp. WL12]
MANSEKLRFKSKFVLMKIGHDLKEKFSDTVEAATPETLDVIAEMIPDHEDKEAVIPLMNVHYVPHVEDILV